MRPLFLFVLLAGCDTAIRVDALPDTPTEAAEQPGPEEADDDVADNGQNGQHNTAPVCSDFLTDPHNTCDGHQDFTLTVLDTDDADGDGLWDDNEVLTVTLELHSAAVHMAYPGILVDAGPAGMAHTPEWWWYGIQADDSYEVEIDVVRTAQFGSDAELVFTVGALNCATQDPQWSDCPHPTPKRVRVPLAP